MKVAQNLRIFYGVEAVFVWQKMLDMQRQKQSMAVYGELKLKLQEHLALENRQRGSLVLQRSNEVTEVKERYFTAEKRIKEIGKEILEKSEKVGSFFELLQTVVKSWFGMGESAEKIRQEIVQLKEEESAQQKIFKEHDRELAGAIYRQMAAIDPIRDLEFALDYLAEAIEKCRVHIEERRQEILQLTREKCLNGGAELLDLMFKSGLQVVGKDVFAEKYLTIHESAFRRFSKPEKRVVEGSENLIMELGKGIQNRTVAVSGNIYVSGKGTHHRRVKSGKNHRWKEFGVDFYGPVYVPLHFSQKYYDEKVVQTNLNEDLKMNFLNGRNKYLTEWLASQEKSYSLELKQVEELFQALISQENL